MRRLLNVFRLPLILSTVLFCLVSCSDKVAQLSPLESGATVLAFGDSLTFGTGANSKTESYPVVLSGLTGWNIINEGLPGEISKDGLVRLREVLEETHPKLVILCHGGNDIIRNLGHEQLKSNLDQMITLIKSTGAEVVLIGVPKFNLMLNVPSLYSELALKHDVPIELSIIPDIISTASLKADQVHPNAKGYASMADSIYKLLEQSGAF